MEEKMAQATADFRIKEEERLKQEAIKREADRIKREKDRAE
jgi:hypothetical protein